MCTDPGLGAAQFGHLTDAGGLSVLACTDSMGRPFLPGLAADELTKLAGLLDCGSTSRVDFDLKETELFG